LINCKSKGYWNLIVVQARSYEIELRRWSEESLKTLADSLYNTLIMQRSARPIAKAQLLIQDIDQIIDTKPEATVARFVVQLKAGKTKLTTNLIGTKWKIHGFKTLRV
jgi:hypothetical protein